MPLTRHDRKNAAVVLATALAVICPHCNEPQPDPVHGSDVWEAQQYRDACVNAKHRTCTSCSVPFMIHFSRRVGLGA